MPVDYAKVKKIFLGALEHPIEKERPAFVEEQCGTDVDLRDFVIGMLEAHQQHATPIPEGQTRIDPQYHTDKGPALASGTILGGKYKIVEMIAEGGMGSVYRATRIADLRMDVAIKVIKPGMDSQQVLARFSNEQQALAMMKHENIARVLDAGMTDLRLPFFVMELVKGMSLTKFCDENKLSIPERLELFEKVCSAVQHAHQKGIVHRDLKPSNILVTLVDNKPVPKVIDFGLAKALYQPLIDDPIMTRFGTFVGTWQYTAPEQARQDNLDIDTRADIYSLGVILYELLTGSTPMEKRHFADAAIQEVLRMIREEEPPKPSTKIHSSEQLPSIAALRSSEPLKLERLVRGELDWIVMKALEKDRNRRYGTASDFAADLQRFRNQEPVQAGPPTFSYRASKYLRKHWGAVMVGMVLAGAITIGAVVSTVGWYVAEREKERAKTQTEIALAINNFLKELLSEADPGVQIKPDQQFVSNITVKKALDRAAEKVGSKFVGKPLVEAAIRHTMGKTYLGLGDLPSARLQFEKAEELLRNTSGPKDLRRLQSLYEVAWVSLLESKFTQADELFKNVIELLEQTAGPVHVDTLKAKFGQAILRGYQDKKAESKQLLQQVLADQKKHLGVAHRDTLTTQRGLSTLLQEEGNLTNAEKLMVEVLEIQQRTLGKGHPETFITMNNLGLILDDKQDYVKAETIFNELIRMSETTLGKEHPEFLSYQCNLASVLASQKQYDKAAELYQKIIPTLKQIHGLRGDDTLGALQNYGSILTMNGSPKDGEPYLQEALRGCLETLGLKHAKTRQVIENLIVVYKKLKIEAKVKDYEAMLRKSKET